MNREWRRNRFSLKVIGGFSLCLHRPKHGFGFASWDFSFVNLSMFADVLPKRCRKRGMCDYMSMQVSRLNIGSVDTGTSVRQHSHPHTSPRRRSSRRLRSYGLSFISLRCLQYSSARHSDHVQPVDSLSLLLTKSLLQTIAANITIECFPLISPLTKA